MRGWIERDVNPEKEGDEKTIKRMRGRGDDDKS
jgi:hypothetical protein